MIGFGRDRIDEGDLKVSGSISSSGKLGTSSMCLFRICNRRLAIVSFVYQSNTAPVHQGLVMLLRGMALNTVEVLVVLVVTRMNLLLRRKTV